MSVESVEDRAAFFDPDEFGSAATYAKAAGGSAALNGLFTNPSTSVELGPVATIDSNPSFLCRSADIPAGAVGGSGGDTLTIDAVIYQVLELRPDGTGMTRIELGR
ncbi:MAG: hypothetical protein EPO23_03265 [Xanthobacteraceae bacterium]|nr:MAG: hypothetical protein EPO23_03265 [Xanthobacteraceae bacterium]